MAAADHVTSERRQLLEDGLTHPERSGVETRHHHHQQQHQNDEQQRDALQGAASKATACAGSFTSAECLTCACAFLAGSGTWLPVTAIFAEGSLLVTYFNDKELYSTMDLAVQFGNSGPFVCVALLAAFTARRGADISMFLLVLGSACLLWTAVFWRKAGVAGIVASSFFGGLVGSTSMVTIYSAAGQLSRNALVSVSAGTGVCGVISTMFRLMQGDASSQAGSNRSEDGKRDSSGARFGLTAFMLIAFGWQSLSCLGWLYVMVQRRRAMDARRDATQRRSRNAGDGNATGEEDGDVEEASTSSTECAQETRPLADGEEGRGFGGESSARQPLLARGPSAKDGGESGTNGNCDDDTKQPRFADLLPYSFELTVVFLSCFLQYAVPGYVPFLDKDSNKVAALTAIFLCSTVLGRAALLFVESPRHKLTYGGHLFVQFASFIIIAILSSRGEDGSSTPAWCFSISIAAVLANGMSHGFIITTGYANAESAHLRAWTGAISQAGALTGALSTFIYVRT